MTNLTRWTPFGTELDSFANRFFENVPSFFPLYNHQLMRSMQPPVDIKETEKAIEMKADLPAMKKEDIELAVSDNVLTLSGKRTLEECSTSETCHCQERFEGEFSRSFKLPESANADKIDAKFKDGVLSITIPKIESKKVETNKVKIK